jgi:hypothetical protein
MQAEHLLPPEGCEPGEDDPRPRRKPALEWDARESEGDDDGDRRTDN